MRPMPALLGLYIHIPFCKSKCVYCDFYSLPRSESRMDDYTDALCAHLAETAPFAAGHLVDTVYFGGGTPSYLGTKRLGKILKTLLKKYQVIEPLDVLEDLDGFSRLVIYPTVNVILMGDDVRALLETFREGEEEDGKSEI